MAYRNKTRDEHGKVIGYSTWYASIRVYDPELGRRRKIREGGFATKRAALEREPAIKREVLERRYLPPAEKQRLAEETAKEERDKLESEEPMPTLASIRSGYLRVQGRRYIKGYPISPGWVDEKDSYFKNHLLKAFPQPLVDITSADVEEFINQLIDDGKAPSTVSNIAGELRVILKWAKKKGLIESLPEFELPGKSPPDKDKFLDFEESVALLEAAEASIKGMIFFAINTGTRFGEFTAARRRDIDLDRGVFRLRIAVSRGHIKHPKERDTEDIPLTPQLVAFLRWHLAQSKFTAPDTPVFCDDEGKRHTYSKLRAPFERSVKAAGLDKNVTWHWLRHSFASHLAMMNVSSKFIQEFCRHADSRITVERYMHLAESAKQEQIGKLQSIYSMPDLFPELR